MTKPEVTKLLRQHHRTWTEFLEFMAGQTVGLYPDGSVNYYEYDVHQFITNQDVKD